MRHIIAVSFVVSLVAQACSTARGPLPSPRELPPPRALLVVTSHSEMGETGQKTGYFLSEVVHPYFALRDAGIEVDFASPKGGNPPADPKSLDFESDPRLKEFWEDPNMRGRLEQSLPLATIDPSDYQAVVFAGGHGTMWDFPNHPEVVRLGSEVYRQGGVVAAVCHGPAALVGMTNADGSPLVSGRKVAAFTNEEEAAVKLSDTVPFLLESKLRDLGAFVQPGPLWKENVVVDGRLVTGQNPASAHVLGVEVAALINRTRHE